MKTNDRHIRVVSTCYTGYHTGVRMYDPACESSNMGPYEVNKYNSSIHSRAHTITKIARYSSLISSKNMAKRLYGDLDE